MTMLSEYDSMTDEGVRGVRGLPVSLGHIPSTDDDVEPAAIQVKGYSAAFSDEPMILERRNDAPAVLQL